MGKVKGKKNFTKNKHTSQTHKGASNLRLKVDLDEEYGTVSKVLGNRFVECDCLDGKNRLCKIRGTVKKNKTNWISIGDIVLVCLRDFQDDKADIVKKYQHEEIRQLKKLGHLPMQLSSEDVVDFTKKTESDSEGEDDGKKIDFNLI